MRMDLVIRSMEALKTYALTTTVKGGIDATIMAAIREHDNATLWNLSQSQHVMPGHHAGLVDCMAWFVLHGM